jgi:hypothetical protein
MKTRIAITMRDGREIKIDSRGEIPAQKAGDGVYCVSGTAHDGLDFSLTIPLDHLAWANVTEKPEEGA